MVSFQAQRPVPADTSEIKADKEMSNTAKQTPHVPRGRITAVAQPSGVYHVIYSINYCFDIHTDRTPCHSAWEMKTTSIAVPSFKDTETTHSNIHWLSYAKCTQNRIVSVKNCKLWLDGLVLIRHGCSKNSRWHYERSWGRTNQICERNSGTY